jgi:hypothetical protein
MNIRKHGRKQKLQKKTQKIQKKTRWIYCLEMNPDCQAYRSPLRSLSYPDWSKLADHIKMNSHCLNSHITSSTCNVTLNSNSCYHPHGTERFKIPYSHSFYFKFHKSREAKAIVYRTSHIYAAVPKTEISHLAYSTYKNHYT